ncbi:MAG: hypothetical protein KGJ55_12060 [Gammaproteobacteria bacterium]|nr:hypothetical protein [Gammaproteobacteria bacterium]
MRLVLLYPPLLIALAAASGAAAANDFVVYSPSLVQGQNELETRAFYFQDGNGSKDDGEYEYNIAAGHTFTSWWKSEVYFVNVKRDTAAGETPKFDHYEFEQTFQLAPVGKYFVTPGFLLSYEPSTRSNTPDTVEYGPLFERQDGRFTQRLNLIWEREVGGGASGKPAFRNTYSLSYRWRPTLQPAMEVYLRYSDNNYHLGPMIYGELNTPYGGEIEYKVGAVFGVNRDTPNATWIARFEYEFF